MALIGLIVYTFILYVRPQDIFVELGGERLVMFAVLATLVLAIATEPLNVRRLFGRPATLCLLGFFASLVMSHLSWLYLTGAKESFEGFGKIFLLVALIVWIVRTPARLRLYLWILLIAAGLLAVQGVQQYLTGFNWGGVPILTHHLLAEPRIRGLGIFSDPNDLALTLVFVVPLALGSLMGGAVPRNPLVGAPLLGLLLYAIYLTHSRGGFLALGVTLLAVIWQRWGRRVALPVAVVMGAGGLVMGAGKLAAAISGDPSSMDRLWLWSEGLQMMKAAPVFGVGQGLFMDYVPQTAHNSVILALAEAGLVGGFFWIAAFYFASRDLVKVASLRRSADPQVRDLAKIAASLLSGMAGSLTAAFFLSRTYIVVMYIPLALAVACAGMAIERLPVLGAETRPTRNDWKWIAGLEACTILGVYILVRTLRW